MFDFDDILLMPKSSIVNSRDDADVSVQLSDTLKLDIPIIGSPMKGIMGVNLIKELSNLGGIGIFHRFWDSVFDWEDALEQLQEYNFGVALSLDDPLLPNALDSGAKLICIDVANGYLESVLKFTTKVANRITKLEYNSLLMVGNIATAVGARSLSWAGANLIRVGIGSGNLCTTRNITGVGVPQLSAIELASSINQGRNTNPRIIADGGIRNSGDAVKAFAFGADAVMLGSLLATTFESANNGIIYGMASRKLQEEYYHSVKSVEGIEQQVTPKQNLAEFVDEFVYGIKSACTYLNAQKIRDLREADRIQVTPSVIKKF